MAARSISYPGNNDNRYPFPSPMYNPYIMDSMVDHTEKFKAVPKTNNSIVGTCGWACEMKSKIERFALDRRFECMLTKKFINF